MALRFAGLGSVVERSTTKAATSQASLSAARRGDRSDVVSLRSPLRSDERLLLLLPLLILIRCARAQQKRHDTQRIYKKQRSPPTWRDCARKTPSLGSGGCNFPNKHTNPQSPCSLFESQPLSQLLSISLQTPEHNG